MHGRLKALLLSSFSFISLSLVAENPAFANNPQLYNTGINSSAYFTISLTIPASFNTRIAYLEGKHPHLISKINIRGNYFIEKRTIGNEFISSEKMSENELSLIDKISDSEILIISPE